MIAKYKKLLKEERFFNILILLLIRLKSRALGYLLKYRVNSLGSKSCIASFCYVQGGRSVNIGSSFVSGKLMRLQLITRHKKHTYSPYLNIGNNVNINDYFHLGCAYNIAIGDGTLIGSNVLIIDHNHGKSKDGCLPIDTPLTGGPIKIGKNVWIADNVTILPNVNVGDGALIGAGSVVTKDVAPHSTVIGIPARAI